MDQEVVGASKVDKEDRGHRVAPYLSTPWGGKDFGLHILGLFESLLHFDQVNPNFNKPGHFN